MRRKRKQIRRASEKLNEGKKEEKGQNGEKKGEPFETVVPSKLEETIKKGLAITNIKI
jgi:hypothetical protein